MRRKCVDSPVDHHFVDLLPVLLVLLCAHIRVQFFEGDSGHVDPTPHGHCGDQKTPFNPTDRWVFGEQQRRVMVEELARCLTLATSQMYKWKLSKNIFKLWEISLDKCLSVRGPDFRPQCEISNGDK